MLGTVVCGLALASVHTGFVLALKCFVLIDLKTERITHQDVGQMDMYIRMYDELKKAPDDNPTLGIVFADRRRIA